MDVSSFGTVLRDFGAICICGVTLQLIKFLLWRRLYPRLANECCLRPIVQQTPKQEDKGRSSTNSAIQHETPTQRETRITGFTRSLWGFTWHSAQFLLEIAVLSPTDLWRDVILNPFTKSAMESLYSHTETDLTFGIQVLFWSQIGYYATELVVIGWIFPAKDWKAMMVHHVAALLLLGLCYIPTLRTDPAHVWKVGAVVLLYQEIGDVTLQLAKMLHYVPLDAAANVVFVASMVIWIVTRLVYSVPLYVGVVRVWQVVDQHGVVKSADPMKRWQTVPCFVLLWSLYLLQTYWVVLMAKVLCTAVLRRERVKDPQHEKEEGERQREKQEEEEEETAGRVIEVLGDVKEVQEVVVEEEEVDEEEEKQGDEAGARLTRRNSLVLAYEEEQNTLPLLVSRMTG